VCRRRGEEGFKYFRERVLANFDKMKAVFHGRHATGEMGF